MNTPTRKPRPLRHLTSRGRIRAWDTNKRRSLAIAKAYARIAQSCADPHEAGKHRRRSDAIGMCSRRLDFVVSDADQRLQLANAYRCKSRHCSLCAASSARAAYAVFAELLKRHAEQYPRSLIAMLTLTVPSCSAERLAETIGMMQTGFRKMRNAVRFKRAVIGWRRALEITWNPEKRMFHPHYHVMLCLDPDYWSKTSGAYLSKRQWQDLWQRSTRQPLAIVDIRKKGKDRNGVLVLGEGDGLAEAAKYVVKPQELYRQVDGEVVIDDDVLAVLHTALKSRRLFDYGGSLKSLGRVERPDGFADDAERRSFIWGELIEANGDVHEANYWPEELMVGDLPDVLPDYEEEPADNAI